MSAPIFPTALVTREQWLAWRPDKVPYVGPAQRFTNQTKLLSYAAAIALATSDGFAGVGFRVTANDPICFVDLDWKHDPSAVPREMPAWAQAILDRFPGTYAEWSVSLKGLHIVAIGKPDVHGKSPDGRVEMYDRGQYCALTGDALPGRTEVVDFAAELRALKAEFLIASHKPDVAPLTDAEGRDRLPPRNVDLSNDAVMALIAQQHATWFTRYVEGDLPPLPIGAKRDESKDDGALIHALVEYVGWDEARIEELARTSALKREKWDSPRKHRFTHERTTYLGFTIRNLLREQAAKRAVAATTEPAVVRSMADYLRDPDALKPPPAVIPRLAWSSRIVGLNASAGTGKSTIYKAGCAAVTRGRDFLGAPTVEGTALWARCEESEYDLYGNLALFDPDPERFFAFRPGVEPVRQIVDEVRARRPTVTVIDSIHQLLLMAGVGDFNDGAEVGAVFERLEDVTRETGTAMVWIGKANREGTTRNSSEFLHVPDLVYEAKRERSGNVLDLTVVKERFEARGFEVALEGTSYYLTDAAELSQAQEELDQKVWNWIEQHPDEGVNAVRKGVGGKATAIDGAVKRLLEGRARRIVNLGTEKRPKYRVGEPMPEM